MVSWKNLDSLPAYSQLKALKDRVDLAAVLAGDGARDRVAAYDVPMAAGLHYNYAAKAVDDTVLSTLTELAQQAQLIEKYTALLNGEVINTGENRRVLHQLTRGQQGGDVLAEGVNKRAFYMAQQQKAADFANRVHAGEITNAAG